MKLLVLLASIAGTALPVAAQQTTITNSCSVMSLGVNGALNGFVPAAGDAWHTDISTAAVDGNSRTIMSSNNDLGNSFLHPDFGSVAGGGYGIPYVVVDSSQTGLAPVPVTLYGDESDLTLAPLPSITPVEASPAACSLTGDNHAIVIDRKTCVAYEFYQAQYCNAGWTASQSTLWDLTATEQRPYTYTSADAAGLSVFEGLLRYDEIASGMINHALRFTAKYTKLDRNNGYFTAPATHAAGTLWGTDNIIGMRIRLRADFDVSGFSATNRIILQAMKQYGMILADNGSNLFFQGTPDARWNDDDLDALKAVPSSAFEVVQMGAVYDSATAPQGQAPVINSFTASASNVAPGTSVTLTPSVSGASYSYIDNAGFVRDSVTVKPTQTTTYTLTSRNAYGSSSASTTVKVSSVAQPNLAIAPIATQTYGVGAIRMSASSNSSGAITYSATGPALVAGDALVITGAGSVTVTATQAATNTYTSGSATTTFAVAQAVPRLTYIPIFSAPVGSAFQVLAGSNSPGAITYSVVSGAGTVSGNVVTVTGPGTLTLQAGQAATANYVATSANISVRITAACQGCKR